MYHVAVSVRLCHCQTLNLWRVVLAYGFEAHAFSQMYVGGCVGPFVACLLLRTWVVALNAASPIACLVRTALGTAPCCVAQH